MPTLSFFFPTAAWIRLQLELQTWNWCRSRMQIFICYHSSSNTSDIATGTTANQEFGQKRICQLQGNKRYCGTNKGLWSCNSLITRHAKSGRINDARHVFDKMPKRDVVSWNAMIAGYVQNGRIDDAQQLFEKMPERDVVSWTVMITGYGKSGRIEDAYQVFNKMPERNVVSWNSMITRCVQYGKLEYARHLFDKMPERNVVSWTAMIQGYAQNGRVDDAYQLFDRMPDRDVISWTVMITGYANNGRIDNARQLFDKMPERNIVTWTAMIDGYLQNGRLNDAILLFDKMPERNLFSWNAMIAGYAQNGRVADANQLFNKMPERNVVSWNTMIAGYAWSGSMENARQLFDKMPKRNVVSWTTVIAGYARNGLMQNARHLFDKMPERDVISWNAIIAGYAQNWQYEESLKLFSKMQQMGMKPNESSFVSILSACTSLACLEQGKQVHDHIIKNGFESGILLGNALITMYSGCGSIDDAISVFNKMSERDVVSWTAMIRGYAQHGHGKEVLQLFKQMQLAGIKPDHVTLAGVLFACSHAGLVDEGWHFFNSISQVHCITPTVEHYTCMVDLLGRSGRLEEAEDFINIMPFEPNALVWGTLLGACGIHMNLDIGKRVAEQIFQLNPQNAGAYVLLSNIFAAAGRWDDVVKVRMMMKERGVKKQPGCSWIEVKNRVHAFLVGDRSHPETEKIYSMLEILSGQMETAGYVPNTNFVLHDVEQQQKEHILSHHSEKLAIAFGLIATLPGSHMRIIKNLRVCEDCHTAIKFISKIVGRKIVLRDSNRFHCFRDGFCSCGDYW
eukprot:Gb_36222 [translate_table: standard]